MKKRIVAVMVVLMISALGMANCLEHDIDDDSPKYCCQQGCGNVLAPVDVDADMAGNLDQWSLQICDGAGCDLTYVCGSLGNDSDVGVVVVTDLAGNVLSADIDESLTDCDPYCPTGWPSYTQ